MLVVIAGGAVWSGLSGPAFRERESIDIAAANLENTLPQGLEAQARAGVTDEAASRGAARAPSDAREAQVLALVNQERKNAGCRTDLAPDARLTMSARGHSQDMVKRGFFAHTNPDGKDPGSRITAAGYRGGAWAENIAAGQKTPADVMKAWMNSEGHRKNILNCQFKYLGVGVAEGQGSKYGIYWTQNFGG